MVRFSCFSTTSLSRSKKTATQRSTAMLQTDYPCVTEDQPIKFVKGSVKPNLLLDNYNPPSNFLKQSTSANSLRDFWISDAKFTEDNQEMLESVPIKKSSSLESILKKERDYSSDDLTEDYDIAHGLKFDLLNGWNMNEVRESSDTNSSENFHHENDGKIYKNQQKENDLNKSINVLTDPMHHESLFSVEVMKQPGRDGHADKAANGVCDSVCSPGNIPTLARSYSVSNLRVNMAESSKNDVRMFCRSRSFSDLNNSSALEMGLKNVENSFDSVRTIEKNVNVSYSKHLDFIGKDPWSDDTEERGLSMVRGDTIMDHDGKCLGLKLDNDTKIACDLHYSANIADAFKKSEANDAESSHYNWDKLTPREFCMRRVENWINQIDVHGDLTIEELGESSTSICKEELQNLADEVHPKTDTRSRLAMEVAYNYISSLTSSSSSAQLANLGMIAAPILSPFVSLRVLNLSGNSIVHITPGSLPKGLHMLNLSKNNLSTIEGLRDLTHLRVLDLNYNRLARIGHGLASCSSIKELYLAGNKISEVDGLHRLLKLNTLDLRFNKISTAKGLGQLAANYGSLQAINLDGNPAQKNVGDEQLKRFLLSLLPNLVYYNKQAIRMASKEAPSRAERAVAPPHFDRGIRGEHKLLRRASHGSGLHQLASRREQQIAAVAPSRKPSKERHVRLQLPPAASALTKLRSDAMKRSRSAEGLAVLSKPE